MVNQVADALASPDRFEANAAFLDLEGAMLCSVEARDSCTVLTCPVGVSQVPLNGFASAGTVTIAPPVGPPVELSPYGYAASSARRLLRPGDGSLTIPQWAADRLRAADAGYLSWSSASAGFLEVQRDDWAVSFWAGQVAGGGPAGF